MGAADLMDSMTKRRASAAPSTRSLGAPPSVRQTMATRGDVRGRGGAHLGLFRGGSTWSSAASAASAVPESNSRRAACTGCRDWKAVVGLRLSRRADPREIQSLEGGRKVGGFVRKRRRPPSNGEVVRVAFAQVRRQSCQWLANNGRRSAHYGCIPEVADSNPAPGAAPGAAPEYELQAGIPLGPER